MVKLIVLYAHPEDKAAFDERYRKQHIAIAKKLPGLRRYEMSWVKGSPGGEPRYHLVAELYFDDMQALKAALKSPEGGAAGQDAMSFAGKIIHMMTAEVEEG